MKKNLVIPGVALLLLSCTEKKSDYVFDRVSSFKVEVTSGAMGTPESPLPFIAGGSPYSIQVTAIDAMGLIMTSFSGPVTVSAEPGKITGPALTLNNGTGSVTVTLEKAFGVTRIWVEDPKTFATGVTDAIHYRGPTLADVQTSTTTITSPFEGERVPVDVQSPLVVTAIARDGFYVTDTAVAGSAWASIFAFNFSAPQGLQVGDQITNLTGRIGEFLGFTELNNPAWEVIGTLPVPAPKAITCADLTLANPNLLMESYEAGLIEVTGVTVAVCAAYPNCPDYDVYRQWTLELAGGCEINTISRYTLGGFDPLANHGKAVTRMAGTMRHIQFADPEWILEPRDPADVCCPTCTPAMNQGC